LKERDAVEKNLKELLDGAASLGVTLDE